MVRVWFRVLGPVTAGVADRVVPIRRARQRAILGFLLLNRNTPVSTDRLVTALWEVDGPTTARNQVQTELSMLRRLFPSAGASDPVTTVAAGYTLRVSGDQLDLDRFTTAVAQARATEDPSGSVELLRSALDLWTGTPLDGLTASYVSSYRLHLMEQRLQAYEQLFDLELRRGRHGAVLPELFDFVERFPLRARLTSQLMLALYRDGRQAEALTVLRSSRATLVAEHGLEPDRHLRDLERDILRSDPSLDLPSSVDSPVGAGGTGPPAGGERSEAVAVPRQLPHAVPGFTGRADELARLDKVVAGPDPRPVVVTGMAGVGKTTLSVHWGHRVAGRFPDGQLYVDLRGFDARAVVRDPAEVLRLFLGALGDPAESLPDDVDALAALYRTRMAGRRMLVLLDNARDAAQVRPLLPGGSTSAVVVTSRRWLAGLAVTDGAHMIALDVFTDDEARELMTQRLGAVRVRAEPVAAADIAAGCARLPLALAIITAHAATRPAASLAAVAAHLRDARSGLRPFADADEENTVVAAFSWSYDSLTPGASALFEALGTGPVPGLSVEAAASLAGIAYERADVLMAELVRGNLVVEPTTGRFGMHDLLRAYARDRAAAGAGDGADDGAGDERMRRLLDHYLHSAHRAAILFQPGRRPLDLSAPADGVTLAALADRHEALAWLRTEHDALVTLATRAGIWGFDRHAWQLSWCLTEYFFRVGHWSDWVRVQTAALTAARRLDDRSAMAVSHRGLARALGGAGRYAEAEAELGAAEALSAELGDPGGQGLALQILCDLYGARGDHRAGVAALRRALAIYDEAGHALGRAAVLNNLGLQYSALGRHDAALEHCEEALRLFTARGEINGVGAVEDTLGQVHHRRGDHASAIEHFARAIEIKQAIGERYLEAMTLIHLGESHLALGHRSDAGRAWSRAYEILDALEHPQAQRTRARLREHGLGDPAG